MKHHASLTFSLKAVPRDLRSTVVYILFFKVIYGNDNVANVESYRYRCMTVSIA